MVSPCGVYCGVVVRKQAHRPPFGIGNFTQLKTQTLHTLRSMAAFFTTRRAEFARAVPASGCVQGGRNSAHSQLLARAYHDHQSITFYESAFNGHLHTALFASVNKLPGWAGNTPWPGHFNTESDIDINPFNTRCCKLLLFEAFKTSMAKCKALTASVVKGLILTAKTAIV